MLSTKLSNLLQHKHIERFKHIERKKGKLMHLETKRFEINLRNVFKKERAF